MLGLYNSLALPVNRVDAVPDVAFANNGKTLVAVLVSLLSAAPPTEAHVVPLYPSNSVVVVLKRNMPDAAVGRCAVVPLLMVNAPVEVNDESEVAVRTVNVPVFAVVAPTVPLMLIEAVPVKLVTTPLAGVPRAGVTKVGLVARTMLPVPVTELDRVTPP